MQDSNSDTPKKTAQKKDISAWEQTLRWLDAKWYSESKLRERLNKLHYPEAEIEEVIARCREYNLVNDAALAQEFAQSQSSRGRGSRRIAFELRRHGLTGEAADNALNNIAGNEEAAALTALQSKMSSLRNEPDWRKRREKAFRFLAYRGFGPETVYQILDSEPLFNSDYDPYDCPAVPDGDDL